MKRSFAGVLIFIAVGAIFIIYLLHGREVINYNIVKVDEIEYGKANKSFTYIMPNALDNIEKIKNSKEKSIIIKCLNKEDDYITETELERLSMHYGKVVCLMNRSSVKSDEIYCMFYIRDEKDRIKVLGVALANVQSKMLNKESKHSYGVVLSKIELSCNRGTRVKKCNIGFEVPEGDEFLEPTYIEAHNKIYYVINNLVKNDSNEINWECRPYKMKNIKKCELQAGTYLKSRNNYVKVKFQINEIQFINGTKKYKIENFTLLEKMLKK